MKTIGTHAKHALALILALIMLFGIVSVPVFAYEGSTATAGGESTGTPAGGSEGSGGTSSAGTGEKDTPWYTLTYDYTTKKMTLVIKTDILSYADLTKEDILAFKDAFFDALAHMLVGDISDIKKIASSGSSETAGEGTLRVVTLPDFSPLLGGEGELSEREKQLRAFLESRGITKVSQIDFEAIIPVLVQLGYVTYEELATLNWDHVFSKFEEELDKEIAADLGIVAPDKVEKADEPTTVVPDPGEGATEEEKKEYENYLAEKEAYENYQAYLAAEEQYRTDLAAAKETDEFKQKKEEPMNQITEAKVKVEQKIEEKKNDPNADEKSDILLAEAILNALNGITLDGHRIFDGQHFLTDAVREVLRELPTFREISEYTDAQMNHTWSVFAESAFGNSDFAFTVSFDGAGNLIRKVAKLIADYVVYERRADGTYVVTLNPPKKLTDLILRVCNSEKFKNSEWKDRIFGHIAEDGNGIYALINDVSFDEIVAALEKIDFEGILSREDIKDIYDLTDLTNEQIMEKIRATERFYNKALSLFNKVFGQLPDSAKSKTLLDFYRGDGTFHAEGKKENLNVESWLNRILPAEYGKYAALLAGLLDSETISVALNATVNFKDVYKITFAGDKNEIGFLPVGATLSDFVKATTYRGYPILGWADADGTQYTKMPALDAVLYPVIDATVTAELVYAADDIARPYNNAASEILVRVTYDDPEGNAVYAYQWYRDGVLLAGETAKTLQVKNVADSGVYTCTVTVTDGSATYTATSDAATVAITQKLYTFKDNFRWDYIAPFYPDGNPHAVTLIPDVDDFAGIHITYTNDNREQSATGNYTTGATVTFDNENCALSGGIEDLAWAIGVREADIVTEDGFTIGRVTLTTDGVAVDPSYVFRAVAAPNPDLDAIRALLPAGTDSVGIPYAFDFGFYDAAGNRVDVASALKFSFLVDPAIAKNQIAFVRVADAALSAVDSVRTAADLTFESDALLTADTVRYALVTYQYTLTVTPEATEYAAAYDGARHLLALASALYGHEGADVTYTYQWFRDGAKITGATDSSYAVSTVADSGTYTLVVTVKDGFAERSARFDVTVRIEKLTVDLSALLWSESEFPYLVGAEREVTLLVPDELSVANLVFSYIGNKASVPGTYTAKATVESYDSDNCTLTGAPTDHTWSISNKAFAVLDHFGGEIVVSSATGFPAGYVLHADWLEGLTPPDGLVSGAECVLIGGHRVYFTDAAGNAVTFADAVTLSFTIPESGKNENLKLVRILDGAPAILDAVRNEDGTLTLSLDSFDKDASYLLVAYRFPLTLDPSGDVNVSYDATQENIELRVIPSYYNSALPFTYQWYKNGELLEGETGATLLVPMKVGKAGYVCRVSVKDGYATVTKDSDPITVTVTHKPIDTSAVTLPDFIYRLFAEDPTIEITPEMLRNLPAGVVATIDTASEYKASTVGIYTVNVLFSLSTEYADNYELDVPSRTLKWKITPYNIRIGTPSWNYTSPLTYSGSEYTFTAPELDANANLLVTYRNNTAKTVGTYTAVVTVAPANENCLVNGKESVTYSATFVIEPKTISTDLLLWNETTFFYDGNAHRPTLKDLSSYTIAGVGDSLADILRVTGYTGDFATDVLIPGATLYSVTAHLEVLDENYRLTASKKILEWNMTAKPLDVDHVQLEENVFDYDGTEKTVTLRPDTIPAELLATLDPSTEISATEQGYHSVTVRFALKDGLNSLNYTFEESTTLLYRIVTVIRPEDFTFTGGTLVYNGSEQAVPALSFGAYTALIRVTGIEGTQSATDAGSYSITYTFALTSDTFFRLAEESHTYTWTIEKQKITVDSLTWNYSSAFMYDPDAGMFTVAITDTLSENVHVSYENASAKNAGTYLAKAILTPVSENYEIVLTDPASTELEWTIARALIEIPAVEWQDAVLFPYDGTEKSVLLKTLLPDTVTVEYLDNRMTDAGRYQASATLVAKDANYRVVIGDTDQNVATLDWEITPITVTVATPEWNYTDREFVFSTEERTFLITNLPEHVSVRYENNTIGNVGTYTLRATLVADKNYKIEGTEEVSFTFTVTPVVITVNAADLRWQTDAASERYDATTHIYKLVGVPEHIIVTYRDNAQSALGNYVASAVLTAESDNYSLVVNGEIPTKAWSIVKGLYDMSGVTFENKSAEYDGKAHALTIGGKLPAGVTVSYDLTACTEAGVYRITASFKGSANYEEIPSMTATLTITRQVYTVSTDGDDTLVITAPDGLTYRLSFTEKDKAQFKDVSFLGIGTLNEKITLSAAYDIFFTEDGENEVHPEGTFTVKLLIPETLRKKDVKVVHLTDNGKVTDMEATRDGDYMTFTTDGFSVYFLVEATEILAPMWIEVIMAALCVLLLLIIVIELIVWRKKAKKRKARKEYPDILSGADPSVFNFGK